MVVLTIENYPILDRVECVCKSVSNGLNETSCLLVRKKSSGRSGKYLRYPVPPKFTFSIVAMEHSIQCFYSMANVGACRQFP